MDELLDITIVVASLNRPKHALRTLKYWSSLKINTHLVDGSDQPIPKSKLVGLDKRVNYYHVKIFSEIDTLRVKFEKQGNKDNLLFLEDINAYVEQLEKFYSSV